MTEPGPLSPYLESLADAVTAGLVAKGQVSSSASGEACRRDVRLQIDALDQALAAQRAEQFAEMIAWLSVYLAAVGVDRADLDCSLEELARALTGLEGLSEELKCAAQEAVAGAQARLEEPRGLSATIQVPPAAPAGEAEELDAWVRAGRERLAALTVTMHYVRRPDAALRHGELQWRCLEDAGFHFDHLSESLAANDSALFRAYLDWCRSVLARLDLEHELEDHLRSIRDVLSSEAPAHLAETLARFLDEALQPSAEGAEQTSFLVDDAPHVALARSYLAALLDRNRREACRLVVEAAGEGGVPVAEVYQHVFQPAQHEVGRLWQIGQISVAQEHYCTAATQMAMSQLYPLIFSDRRRNRTVVATCVGGNLHEIGIRFVADMFELDGWDSIYLGANTPSEHLVGEVAARNADLVAISATLSTHLSGLRELIQALRDDARTAAVKIIVGGYPFMVVPTLWKAVGADGTALSATDAVTTAASLIESS